ncbi:MAG: hypothetical protein Q8P18_26030 [Pseudomonadota bacterium]|nr:hypothetical protein [Pseudomonadota bacterium]
MRGLALLFALAACSEYDLGNASDDPKTPDRRDTDTPPVDTSTTPDTSTDTDSGTVVVPDDTGDDTTPPDTDTPVDVPDGKIDVVLLIDVAYIYDCYHADLPANTDALVRALLDSGANVAVSIATYDDYQVSGEWYAASGGLPYALLQQITTDRSGLLAAASRLSLDWGGDGPGTGLEAIVQATTGDGYDQSCDGRFDATTDIRPFNARSSDAFGGGATGSAVTSTPGTGTKPGVGFRDGSKRVVVILAENTFRDQGESHDFPTGSCSAAKTITAAVNGLTSVDAKFLGVNAYEFQDIDTALQGQLVDLARSTSSQIDADNDGAYDDVAVLSGSWDWPATDVVMKAIFDLAR